MAQLTSLEFYRLEVSVCGEGFLLRAVRFHLLQLSLEPGLDTIILCNPVP